jgi:hydrogenase nickel incorporation protein HypA/HybF
MHELSIAGNILEIIWDNVPEENLPEVKTVKLELGEMAGIVADSLLFCFDVIKLDTPFFDANLDIKMIPFVLYCNKCKKETTNSLGIRMCEECKEFDTEIISGTEMRVTEVELTDT